MCHGATEYRDRLGEASSERGERQTPGWPRPPHPPLRTTSPAALGPGSASEILALPLIRPSLPTLRLPRVLVPPPLRPLPSTLWPYLPGIRSQHWHAGQFPPPPGPRRPHLRGTLQLHLELRQLQCGLGQGLAKSFVLTAQLCIQLGAPGGGTRGSGLPAEVPHVCGEGG